MEKRNFFFVAEAAAAKTLLISLNSFSLLVVPRFLSLSYFFLRNVTWKPCKKGRRGKKRKGLKRRKNEATAQEEEKWKKLEKEKTKQDAACFFIPYFLSFCQIFFALFSFFFAITHAPTTTVLASTRTTHACILVCMYYVAFFGGSSLPLCTVFLWHDYMSYSQRRWLYMHTSINRAARMGKRETERAV